MAVLATAGSAFSQTWVTPAKTPGLLDIVVVDRTGEPNWIFGFEDVLKDGKKFTAAEQALDIRTAYAATDATRLWLRAYFSTQASPPPGETLYVFIDNDKNPMTGGSAAQKTIDPAFTTDPTHGGYEVVLVVNSDRTFGPLWTWNQAQGTFVASTIKKNEGVATFGVDVDPILLYTIDHGFVQSSVDLNLLGLDATCQASLFLRSLNTAGKGDLDVGAAAKCRPDDGNDDGIPDIIVPVGCKTSADCPNHGICLDGVCRLAPPCSVDTDCKGANEMCTPDGRCVPKPTGTCKINDDCTNGLVCKTGTCSACVLDSDDCGAGETCLPDGTCLQVATGAGGSGVGGSGGGTIKIPRGGGVRGGACTCTAAGNGENEAWMFAAIVPALAWWSRRRRRGSRQEA